jgi:hypothetical protein
LAGSNVAVSLDQLLAASTLPYLLAATLMAVLGTWLIARDPRDRAMVAFAVVLFLLSLRMTFSFLAFLSTGVGPEDSLRYAQILPYFQIALVPAAVYFAANYPEPRGWLGRSQHGLWLLVGVTLVLELAYFLQPSLYGTLEYRAVGAELSYRDVGRYLIINHGPLHVLLFSTTPILAFIAYLFAKDYVRSEAGDRRHALFLILSAILLLALFDFASYGNSVYDLFFRGEVYPWLPFGWTAVILPLVTIVPIGMAFAVLARHVGYSGEADAMRQFFHLALVAPLPILSVLLPLFIDPNAVYMSDPWTRFALGIWRLAFPLLVSYALLRYPSRSLRTKAPAQMPGMPSA